MSYRAGQISVNGVFAFSAKQFRLLRHGSFWRGLSSVTYRAPSLNRLMDLDAIRQIRF